MASAANAPSEQENRDPDRPRITRRNRGDYTRNEPLDLEYLQRPSYCDASFALELITQVLIPHLYHRERHGFHCIRRQQTKKKREKKRWPNYVQSLLGNGTGSGEGGGHTGVKRAWRERRFMHNVYNPSRATGFCFSLLFSFFFGREEEGGGM